MRGKKKVLAVILILAIGLTLLSACQQNENPPEEEQPSSEGTPSEGEQALEYLNVTGFPIVKEPIKLTMMGSREEIQTDFDEMLVFTEYEKKTGIDIEWNDILKTGYIEQRNVLLGTGGPYPDAFFRGEFNTGDEINYGTQGIFIPLNDLIEEYAPNIKAMLDKYPDVRKDITAPDGNIYTLPQAADYLAPTINNKPWINQKWLDALGLKMPTTTDEFYEVLKAFKEQDPNGNGQPDEIPFVGRGGAAFPVNVLKGSWGLSNRGGRVEHVDLGNDGKVRFWRADDRYKEMLQFINKLYKEQLFDNEAFTQNAAQEKAKLGGDRAGFFAASNHGGAGKYVDDFTCMPPLKGPYGDQMYAQIIPRTQRQGTFAITSSNKYPEATIRWVDYFYSKEGSEFLRMGVEGVTYDKTPEGPVYKDIIVKNPDGLNFDAAISIYAPWSGGGVPHLIFKEVDKTMNTNPVVLAAADLLEPYLPKEVWPLFMFTPEEQERMNALQTDIHSYVDETTAKLISGDMSFDEWDNYINTLKQMGLDEYLDIYQTAYDRWNKS